MDWTIWLYLGAALVYGTINLVDMALPKPSESPIPSRTEISQSLSQSSSSSVAAGSKSVNGDPEAAISAQSAELDRQDQLLRELEDRRRAEAEAEERRQEQRAARRAEQKRLAQEAAMRAEEDRQREQSQRWQSFLKALLSKDKATAGRLARTLDQDHSTNLLLSASDLTSAISSKVGKFARLTVKFDSDAPGGALVFPYSVDLGFRLLGEDIRPSLPQRLFLEGAPHCRFVSDEVITVVGRVKGTYKYDTAIGGTNTVPAIRFEYLFPQSNN